jgi:hypothetical protein
VYFKGEDKKASVDPFAEVSSAFKIREAGVSDREDNNASNISSNSVVGLE